MDDSHKVEPSFYFTGSDYFSQSFTYSSSDLTTSYTDIKNLMPVTQSSRFRYNGGPALSAPSSSYDLYFYDYL